MKSTTINVQHLIALGLALAAFATTPVVRADAVTDWNANTEQAIFTAAQGPPVQGRFLAIVHAAIFDAVNGIQRKYTPYFVAEWGPRGASADAAAAQAAYTALVSLYPTQKATFDTQLANSLAKIPGNRGRSRRRHWRCFRHFRRQQKGRLWSLRLNCASNGRQARRTRSAP